MQEQGNLVLKKRSVSASSVEDSATQHQLAEASGKGTTARLYLKRSYAAFLVEVGPTSSTLHIHMKPAQWLSLITYLHLMRHMSEGVNSCHF